METSQTLLTLRKINKSYNGVQTLKNIDLDIPKGVIYGFIGENGAGKTTTMNIICGLKNSTSGKVIFNNKELNYHEERKYIGYLPQQPKMYSYMTCKEYLKFIISLEKTKDISLEIDELLTIVGLLDAKNKKIKALSGGMLQRLGIAAAICNNPRLVILDEPTSALDPEGRREVMEIIKSLKEKGMTVFFSTHLLSDAENICDFITIIHKGEILVSSTLEAIKDNYNNSYYEIVFEKDIQEKIKEIGHPSFINNIICEDDKSIIMVHNILKDEREFYGYLLSLNTGIKSVTKKESSLEDIFFKVIKDGEKIDL